MRTQLMIATAAAAALLAGAALAQPDTSVNPRTMPSDAATGDATTAAPRQQTLPPSDTTVAPAAGAPAERAPIASVGGTDLVTNGPVPDTAENRAKYGKPLSHAGRASKPEGN